MIDLLFQQAAESRKNPTRFGRLRDDKVGMDICPWSRSFCLRTSLAMKISWTNAKLFHLKLAVRTNSNCRLMRLGFRGRHDLTFLSWAISAEKFCVRFGEFHSWSRLFVFFSGWRWCGAGDKEESRSESPKRIFSPENGKVSLSGFSGG